MSIERLLNCTLRLARRPPASHAKIWLGTLSSEGEETQANQPTYLCHTKFVGA